MISGVRWPAPMLGAGQRTPETIRGS